MTSIGVDIGTTKLCAVRTDEDGVPVKTLTKPNKYSLAPRVPFERIQDPDAIAEAVRGLLDELGTDGAEGIGISNQMHGIVYVDPDGKAVSPFFTWQDERGGQPSPAGGTYAEEFGVSVGYGLCTDFYNRVNWLLPLGAVKFCSIGDYVVMRLCGNKSPLTHITNAGGFGKFDPVRNEFTIEDPMLPDVTAQYRAAGEYRGIPVITAIGDNQASFIGSVKNDSDVLVNIGTGSQISLLSDSPSDSPLLETRPFDGRRFLLAGCALCGGRAFADAVRFVADCARIAAGRDPDDIYSVVDRLLAGYDGPALTVDTRFCGTRQDPSVRGSISGIGESNFTPAALLSGVMNGIASELYDMAGPVCRDVASGKRGLVGSGNGIRKNPAMTGVLERKFRAKLTVPAYPEEAAYGASRLCGYVS